jgi:hypothetical protein
VAQVVTPGAPGGVKGSDRRHRSARLTGPNADGCNGIAPASGRSPGIETVIGMSPSKPARTGTPWRRGRRQGSATSYRACWRVAVCSGAKSACRAWRACGDWLTVLDGSTGDRPLRHNQGLPRRTAEGVTACGRWHRGGAVPAVALVTGVIASRPVCVVVLHVSRSFWAMSSLEAPDVSSRRVPR